MELSTLPRPQLENPLFDERCPATPAAELKLIEVAVAADLRQFGQSVRASALGDPANRPVVVLGGISANCFPAVHPDGSPGWWSGLAGEGQAIDPRHHYVIGLDFAADESGTSAPSTADQARVLAAALDAIGVEWPVTIVGASYGGMVGLALATAEPARVDRLVIISAGAEPHPASTAARELQRRVVSLGLLAGRGDEALAIARGMAMLTYRTPAEFQVRFDGGIADEAPLSCSGPGKYLRARGEAFRSVMSPGRFLSLSASIDRHRVHPEDVNVPCLIIGADSDQLVFPDQLRNLAERLASPAELHLLNSLYGHDMFLKEAERISRIVSPFLAGNR
jgi:homoserine O-acetyltransferase